jgi:hypothetical protein
VAAVAVGLPALAIRVLVFRRPQRAMVTKKVVAADDEGRGHRRKPAAAKTPETGSAAASGSSSATPLGLFITVLVCAASMQDRNGTRPVLLQPTSPVLVFRRRVRGRAVSGRPVSCSSRSTSDAAGGQGGFAVTRAAGGRTHPGVTDRAPATGPRLRARARHLGGDDPLGRDRYHRTLTRPRTSRDPATAPHLSQPWPDPISNTTQLQHT